MDWAKLRPAAWVAGVAYAAEAPHLYYLARIAQPAALQARDPSLTIEQLLSRELLRIAALAVLAAIAGALWSEKNGLGGLGDRQRLIKSWPLVLAGLLASTALYLLLGQEVATAAPDRYPCSLPWAVVVWLKGALFDEVIARFGMMTVMTGVLRRVWAANVAQAAFFSAVGLRALVLAGSGPGETPAQIALATSLAVHLVCGWVYARRGLSASMAVHAALTSRILIHGAFCPGQLV